MAIAGARRSSARNSGVGAQVVVAAEPCREHKRRALRLVDKEGDGARFGFSGA
jgi:hypothetical protein